jgi:hypothetical protein
LFFGVDRGGGAAVVADDEAGVEGESGAEESYRYDDDGDALF